jgi:hypothetical protein
MLATTNSVATPWEGISVTKKHLGAWSALMAVVGVVLMLGASVASAAPTAGAMAPTPSARVTVTVTPTIFVSEDSNGELVTVGTVTPGAMPAATTGAGPTGVSSGGSLVWIAGGLGLVLAAGASYWWLLLRRSTPNAGRRARVMPQPDPHPQERRKH